MKRRLKWFGKKINKPTFQVTFTQIASIVIFLGQRQSKSRLTEGATGFYNKPASRMKDDKTIFKYLYFIKITEHMEL